MQRLGEETDPKVKATMEKDMRTIRMIITKGVNKEELIGEKKEDVPKGKGGMTYELPKLITKPLIL